MVEIMVVITIMLILIISASQIFQLTFRELNDSEKNSRAIFLAQDAVEAAKNLRDRSWDQIETFAENRSYHPEIQNEEWVFVEGSETIDSQFIRDVFFLPVFRNEEGEIVEQGGTRDPVMRKVEAMIRWPASPPNHEQRLVSYLSNIGFSDQFIRTYHQTNRNDFILGTQSNLDLDRYPGNIRLDYNLFMSENFESYRAGADPLHWTDTEANFSLRAKDSLFKTTSLSTINFGTTSGDSNIHSHYTADGSSEWKNVEVSGRMMVTNSLGKIGITFGSKYPTEDKYYLLGNTDSDSTLIISARGTSITPQGINDRDTDVALQSNRWIRFRIQMKDVSDQTLIVAKVWEDGTSEPESWQVDCFDNTIGRSTKGRIGVWTSGQGNKWVDDIQVRNLDAFQNSGIFESNPFHGEGPSAFDQLIWNADLPPQTSISVTVKTAESKEALSSAPYLGPTGVSGYEPNGTRLKMNSAHEGDQWLQYRLQFLTNDQGQSPSFQDLMIFFAPMNP